MINSILNRHRNPVRFDNFRTDTEVITDPDDIKMHIQTHFDRWTAPRNLDTNIFNTLWTEECTPKPYINSEWYSDILQPFSIEEILNTLIQLSNNKACGPSGISYEMIKHSGLGCLTAITALFNWCLRAHTTPKQWKEGYIFPISKKPIFDGNLVNTRPISLVEHIRKLYTKLLTNQLNKTFTQHQILSPFNYVALPSNSTSIPIHILNKVIKDACCNSKPIWLIFQDMSKAYDSVQFELFAKALSRICMPQPLIDTLTNLLFDRHNRVITNLGLTNTYTVKNGIDQEETITPLFWRIYYDPLINNIATQIPAT